MKKKITLFLLCLISATSFQAQVPSAFQYQAVIKGDDGKILNNQNISVRFKIHQEKTDGSIVFVESHQAATTTNGIINLQIGNGIAEHATLSQIDWASNSYFLETEIDKGNGYVNIGTLQLLSVPYSKYAESTQNVRIKSPNGKIWNILIDDNGNISTQEIKQ